MSAVEGLFRRQKARQFIVLLDGQLLLFLCP